jgi:hypothetical protein
MWLVAFVVNGVFCCFCRHRLGEIVGLAGPLLRLRSTAFPLVARLYEAGGGGVVG